MASISKKAYRQSFQCDRTWRGNTFYGGEGLKWIDYYPTTIYNRTVGERVHTMVHESRHAWREGAHGHDGRDGVGTCSGMSCDKRWYDMGANAWGTMWAGAYARGASSRVANPAMRMAVTVDNDVQLAQTFEERPPFVAPWTPPVSCAWLYYTHGAVCPN